MLSSIGSRVKISLIFNLAISLVPYKIRTLESFFLLLVHNGPPESPLHVSCNEMHILAIALD